jgi:hydroxyquinol 1,2-dioxygenase
MKTLTEDGITEEALARLANCPNSRLKEIATSLTRHLHAFAREVSLTPEEWDAGIQFLTEAGHITDDKRQEFILLSDTLGLSAMVDIIANRGGRDSDATESSLLGPFFRKGAPTFPIDADISDGADGERVVVSGRVLNHAGKPIARATIDTWQASADGKYDLQEPHPDEMKLRGRFLSGDDGRFRFRSVRPSSYPVPADGPVGRMLRALGRHPYRPAHVHFMIAAPGYRTLTTALYLDGDRYLDSDAVFGAKESLVVHPEPTSSSGAASSAIDFSFVLKEV